MHETSWPCTLRVSKSKNLKRVQFRRPTRVKANLHPTQRTQRTPLRTSLTQLTQATREKYASNYATNAKNGRKEWRNGRNARTVALRCVAFVCCVRCVACVGRKYSIIRVLCTALEYWRLGDWRTHCLCVCQHEGITKWSREKQPTRQW